MRRCCPAAAGCERTSTSKVAAIWRGFTDQKGGTFVLRSCSPSRLRLLPEPLPANGIDDQYKGQAWLPVRSAGQGGTPAKVPKCLTKQLFIKSCSGSTMDSAGNQWEQVTFTKKHTTGSAAGKTAAARSGNLASVSKCTFARAPALPP
jgi:hypothetical protein